MSEKKAEQINIQCARSTTSVLRGRYFVAFNGSKEKKEKEERKKSVLLSLRLSCPADNELHAFFLSFLFYSLSILNRIMTIVLVIFR
jgi:hypothetical protein